MSTTRYVARDLLTGDLLRDVPLTGVTWGHKLNAAGTLRARVSLPGDGSTEANVTARSLLASLQEGRTALYAYRDSVPVWGGILWEAPYDSDTNYVSVNADDFLSWLPTRQIRWDADHIGEDQLAIVQALVTAAQAQAGGDLGITVGAETSGVLRDFTSWSYQATKLSSAVEQLARARDGFDYAVDVAEDAGVLTRTLRLHYPRRGRRAGETGLVFDYDRRNITKVQVRSRRATNSYVMQGVGEGFLMESTTVTDTSSIDAGYPLSEETYTDKTIDDPELLEQIGREQLRLNSFPSPLLTITTLGDVDPVIGSYIVGDEAKLIIPAGKVARFPDGFEGYRRIVEYSVTPPDGGGSELVAVTFADAL